MFLALLVTAGCSGAPEENAAANGSAIVESQVPIPRFHQVSPGIYRGARPDAAGLQALAQLGVKTVLDLEDSASVVNAESHTAQSLGLAFVSRPMSGFWTPNDAEVDDIESILADPARRPIFVHCQHGEDRTGLVVGIYRVFHEGWSPASAYQEMLDLGFHKILVFLNHYYEEKTGFED